MINMETVKTVNKEQVKQNKRGTAVFMGFSITKEQIKQARFDIVVEKKNTATNKLGELIVEHLDIWEDISKSDEVLELQARLIVVKERDYKQMVVLVNTLLADMSVEEIARKQVISLITGIIA